jgi:hypothetical protein
MTIKFKANLELPTLQRLVLKDADAFVRETIEGAAREWLKAALAIVPAWSGASRATFEALASAVNMSVPIDKSSTAPDRIGLGRLYSSGGISKKGRASYSFYYETTLRYLIANETTKVQPRTEGLFSSLITPTPYKFREAGDRAAQAYIDKRLQELPFLARLFGRKKI